jgi:hypothetical protein
LEDAVSATFAVLERTMAYLIVAAYLLSGLLLLKIVRAEDPDET